MMNINATLFGQIITFAIFIWFVMKFIWPPVMKVMEERRTKIAEGLAAAEKGQRDLELSKVEVQTRLTDAKAKAAHIIDQAQHRANHIVEESKQKARDEGSRLIDIAKTDIDQERIAAREQLMQQVSALALQGAQKVLDTHIDEKAHIDLIDKMIEEI